MTKPLDVVKVYLATAKLLHNIAKTYPNWWLHAHGYVSRRACYSVELSHFSLGPASRTLFD